VSNRSRGKAREGRFRRGATTALELRPASESLQPCSHAKKVESVRPAPPRTRYSGLSWMIRPGNLPLVPAVRRTGLWIVLDPSGGGRQLGGLTAITSKISPVTGAEQIAGRASSRSPTPFE